MKFYLILCIFSMMSFYLGASSRITSVSFDKKDNNGKMIIHLKTPMSSSPELVVKDKMIQVVVPNSSVWPKIHKRVSINKNLDTQILAYQYTKDTVRVRALLPYSIKGLDSKINLVEKGKSVELSFPIVSSKHKDVMAINTKVIDKDTYDESYLEKLLKDKETANVKEKKIKDKQDVVQVKMAAQDKRPYASMLPYIGKFAIFLSLLLLGFLIIVGILKKYIFNKGKLGFLNNTKIVEVLNKTYIGPKKSVLTLKAYEQILLIGVDEKGMHFLTEIKNPVGLLKEGERSLMGKNFDTNIEDANVKDKEFNIKEILDRPAEGQDNKVRFSEHIKNKVKEMKSLQ